MRSTRHDRDPDRRERREEPGLGVADRRTGPHDRQAHSLHPPAHLVGGDGLQDRVAVEPAHHVRRARQHQEQDRDQERGREAESDDAQAPAHAGDDRHQPLPTNVLRPAAEQGDQQGAEGLRRVEESELDRGPAEHVAGERRIQDDRDPEDHRDQIDVERPLQDLLATQESEALADRGPADREPLGGRRRRSHPPEGQDHAR